MPASTIMIEQFITQMAEKVGISEAQARSVIEFLKDNADKVPEILGSDMVSNLKSKLPGGLGGLFD
jgi:hypothetical protein